MLRIGYGQVVLVVPILFLQVYIHISFFTGHLAYFEWSRVRLTFGANHGVNSSVVERSIAARSLLLRICGFIRALILYKQALIQ